MELQQHARCSTAIERSMGRLGIHWVIVLTAAAFISRRMLFTNLTNQLIVVPGFMVGKKYEAEGIAKNGAKMVMAVANVKVGVGRGAQQGYGDM